MAVLVLPVSIPSAADNTAVQVKITRGTPMESLSPDGSVKGVSQGKVGAQFSFVSVSGSQLILQDAQGLQYRIALSSTDYNPATSTPPADTGVSPAAGLEAGLADAPAEVQKTIRANSEGKTINKVERSMEKGEVTYEVETASKDGAEWDLTVANDGTLLSIDMALGQLPPTVQTAISAQKTKGQLEGVAKQFDDGEVTYVAGITTRGGEVRDFTFGEDGTLLSEEIGLNDLSSPDIETAIKTQMGQDKLVSIDRDSNSGQTSYEVTVSNPAGQEHSFTVSDAGALVSKEVELSELSPVVQAGIHAQMGDGKLKSIDQTFDDELTAYDVTAITPAGKKHDFSISEQGALVSHEMTLAETPPAVQATITQAIGDGKIIHIDQIDDTRRKSYEIEAQKDGKPFNFDVGPRGRFLGVQD